jgi:hypothetical protein
MTNILYDQKQGPVMAVNKNDFGQTLIRNSLKFQRLRAKPSKPMAERPKSEA